MTEENDLLVDIVESEHHTRALPVVKYDGIDCSGIKINKTDKYINNEPVYTIDAIYNEEYVIASTTINKETGVIRSVFPVYTNELELGFSGKSVASIICGKILSHHIINNGAVKNGMEPLPLILCVALSVANIKDKFRIYYQAGYGNISDPDKSKNTFSNVYSGIENCAHIINIFGEPSNKGHVDILTKSNNKDLLFDTQLDEEYLFNQLILPILGVTVYDNSGGFKSGCDESNILVKKQLQGNNSCFLMCLSYIECIKTGKIPEDKIEEYFADGRGQLLVMEQAFNFVNEKQRVFKIIDGILSSYCIDTDGVVNDESNTPNIKDTKKDLLVLENSNTNKNVTISDVIDINGANEVLELLYTNKLIEKVNELPKEAVYGEGYEEKEVEEIANGNNVKHFKVNLKPKKQGGCVLL